MPSQHEDCIPRYCACHSPVMKHLRQVWLINLKTNSGHLNLKETHRAEQWQHTSEVLQTPELIVPSLRWVPGALEEKQSSGVLFIQINSFCWPLAAGGVRPEYVSPFGMKPCRLQHTLSSKYISRVRYIIRHFITSFLCSRLEQSDSGFAVPGMGKG